MHFKFWPNGGTIGSPKWLPFTLTGTRTLVPNLLASCPVANQTFHLKSTKCQPQGGAKRKVRLNLKVHPRDLRLSPRGLELYVLWGVHGHRVMVMYSDDKQANTIVCSSTYSCTMMWLNITILEMFCLKYRITHLFWVVCFLQCTTGKDIMSLLPRIVGN